MQEELNIHFPAEWAEQSGVQLTWPHEDTDFGRDLDEVIPCFMQIAQEIAKREKLLLVCRDENRVRQQLAETNINWGNIVFVELDSNDVWARDHGAISVYLNDEPYIYDFCFNGWGMKYPANLDNKLTRKLYFQQDKFESEVAYYNLLDWVLEGGSIESDGCGTMLTTAECLLSENRNDNRAREELEQFLKTIFGLKRVLWLNNGYLAGDDTDSHVDTLARFCTPDTIAYVKCDDPSDEHFEELNLMEEELKSFLADDGKAYNLLALPMADEVVIDGERLPATYANFLIINGAVLLPVYGSSKDKLAKQQLKKVFLDREIIEINCVPLIKQHGSLHCVTMQFPKGFIK